MNPYDSLTCLQCHDPIVGPRARYGMGYQFPATLRCLLGLADSDTFCGGECAALWVELRLDDVTDALLVPVHLEQSLEGIAMEPMVPQTAVVRARLFDSTTPPAATEGDHTNTSTHQDTIAAPLTQALRPFVREVR